MSRTNPADRDSGSDQPDLFDRRGWREAEPVEVAPAARGGVAAANLTDDELIARIPEAEQSTVGTLCGEVVSRSLEAAVPALERLWRRFTGFGVGRPLAEQLAVLNTLARLGGGAARAALSRMVLSEGLPSSLLPAALRAAADAGLVLPAAFVEPLAGHPDVAVREPAFALADAARIGSDRLRDGLTDPSASIRRSAAIAMGKRGDTGARAALIDELGRNPTGEVIQAIAVIADDDVVVHLGRCAERHPAFVDAVVYLLREMENPRAARLARRLEPARSAR